MTFDLAHILAILEHYKYIVIFPIMIIEGPIITVISGFLVYLGTLNMYLVFPLLLVGDLIGDSLYYAVGRYGRHVAWMRKFGYALGYNSTQREVLKNHFQNHTIKTLLIAKISHGLGAVVQVTAGMARVNFVKYLWIEILGTVPKTILLLFIGYYLGSSYIKIDGYLNLIAFIVIGIFVFAILYLVLNKYLRSYFK